MNGATTKALDWNDILGDGCMKRNRARTAQDTVVARLTSSPPTHHPANCNEALIVDGDAWYRDRVLAPCLLAMGFGKVHRAKSISSADRMLAKHDGIGVVVTNATLKRGEDGMAVCRMAKNAAIPVVLLTNLRLRRREARSLVDTIIFKKRASVLQTAQEARKLAA